MNLINGKQGSVVNATAGCKDTDGYTKYTFVCTKAINFIANDSVTNDLYINFDAPVGQAGTIILKAGEVMSDYEIACNELYAKGIGANVPFRAVGV